MPIAFNSFTQADNNGANSLTFAHTTSGTNRILFVSVFTQSPSNDLTSVTYNGVAATQITLTQVGTSNERVYLYYLIAPSTGTNNVVITRSGSSNAMLGLAASYTGANQSGQPDAFTQNSQTLSTTTSGTLTVVASNCWAVALARNAAAGTVSNNSNYTSISTSSSVVMFHTNGTIPTGSYTGTFGNGGIATLWGSVYASFSPAPVTQSATNQFFQYYQP